MQSKHTVVLLTGHWRGTFKAINIIIVLRQPHFTTRLLFSIAPEEGGGVILQATEFFYFVSLLSLDVVQTVCSIYQLMITFLIKTLYYIKSDPFF